MNDDSKKGPGYTTDNDAQNKNDQQNQGQGDLGQKGGEATQEDADYTQMPTDEENNDELKSEDNS